MLIHAAVIEDEPEAAQLLYKCLTRFGQEENHTVSISIYTDAARFLRLYRPVYHVIFMDIRLPEMDGMTAARELRRLDPVIPLVFVTNMAQFAVKGYEVNAMDFIVKPVRYLSFKMKMKRVAEAVKRGQDSGVLITVNGVTQVLRVSDVYYVEVRNHDLTYHTAQGDFTIRGKLGEAERHLPASLFFRCSNSYLVNLGYVRRVFHEDLDVMGTVIRISRSKKREFLSALTAYLGRGG